MAKKNPKIYSVSEVNTLIKVAIEEGLPPKLVIQGEISSWKLHSSGHCYFALKDKKTQMQCVMWKSSFAKCKFMPENGISVLATGFIDIYPPQGKIQFYIEKLEPAGLGSLKIAFEKMVTKLHQEGLFEEKHKKTLPKFPQRIGIMTSQSGAAVGDITDSIYNRWPAIELILLPIPVQGEGAANEIAEKLNEVNKKNNEYKLDLIILGRGGGSMEDLWAFNEEVLARSIFNSEIPIISAVGHEYDMTIADLVADARASTPTKAGVIAVPDKTQVISELLQSQNRLYKSVKSKLELSASRIKTIKASRVYRSPVSIIETQTQLLDDLHSQANSAITKKIQLNISFVNNLAEKVAKLQPHVHLKDRQIALNQKTSMLKEIASRILDKKTTVFNNIQNSLFKNTEKRLLNANSTLNSLNSRLSAINPKSVLKRGYSITTIKDTQKVIKSGKDIHPGQIICTEVADGSKINSSVQN